MGFNSGFKGLNCRNEIGNITKNWCLSCGRLRLKCDGTRAETRFRLSAKQTSPFKSAGASVQSTTGAAEVCASAIVMLDTPCSEVVWRVLDTHFIRQFPLHFPSRASPCAITFQLDSNSEQTTIWSSLFCDVTPCRLVFSRRSSETIYRVLLQGSSSICPLKKGPIGHPEMSVSNYQSARRNIPKHRRSHIHWDGSLIPLKHPLFRVQYKPTSFYNRDGTCPLRGTDWVLRYNSG